MFLGGVQVTSRREPGSLAVSSSTPFSVTSIVCSNCAERLPSCVWKVIPLDNINVSPVTEQNRKAASDRNGQSHRHRRRALMQ